jgi:hypothetical protein
MPPKRKTSSATKAATEDSGSTNDDSGRRATMAAGNRSVPAKVSVRKSTRKSTRKVEDRVSREETSSAKATNTEVSLVCSTGSVATPWDRENPSGSNQGGVASNEILCVESRASTQPSQGSGLPGGSLGSGGGGAVLPNRLEDKQPYYPASSSSVLADYPASASADYPARYVNSADHPATDNPTAVHSASASVNADYPATTRAPVPQLPTAVTQHLPASIPRETLGSILSEIRGTQSGEQLRTFGPRQLGLSSDKEKVPTSEHHRRSLSAGGYERHSRTVDQQASVGWLDTPVFRSLDSSVILPSFDGYGDLNLFLQRFESIADHYRWPPEEVLFRMKQRITGDAEYVLGDAIHVTSVREFVNLLRIKFGSEAHAERYRAELSRLRRGTMTLEQLHLRVHSLVSRAMPGDWSRATEIYARDAFLNALNDDDLRRRIMLACPPPDTLAAAFDLAVRASAFDVSFRPSESREECGYTVPAEKRRKFTRKLTEEESTTDAAVVRRAEFEQVLEDQRKLLAELDLCRERLAKAESALADRPVEPTTAVTERRGKVTVPFDVCRRCGGKGHWARECPLTVVSSNKGVNKKNASSGNARANVLNASRRPRCQVYLDIVYEGQSYRVLLDTGCDVSVIGAKILPGLAYQECAQKMYAANASAVPIAGARN